MNENEYEQVFEDFVETSKMEATAILEEELAIAQRQVEKTKEEVIALADAAKVEIRAVVAKARKMQNWSTVIIAANIILFLYLMWRIYLVA